MYDGFFVSSQLKKNITKIVLARRYLRVNLQRLAVVLDRSVQLALLLEYNSKRKQHPDLIRVDTRIVKQMTDRFLNTVFSKCY
jgi:hypothetical protein